MKLLPLNDRRTAVYRLFAADGALLYVGVSWNPESRLADHRTNKPWWSEVTSIETEWHVDRISALRHEATAIADESPRYNLAGPDPGRIRVRPARNKPRDLSGRTWLQAARAAGIRPWKNSPHPPDEATQHAAVTAYLRWKHEAGVA